MAGKCNRGSDCGRGFDTLRLHHFWLNKNRKKGKNNEKKGIHNNRIVGVNRHTNTSIYLGREPSQVRELRLRSSL